MYTQVYQHAALSTTNLRMYRRSLPSVLDHYEPRIEVAESLAPLGSTKYDALLCALEGVQHLCTVASNDGLCWVSHPQHL